MHTWGRARPALHGSHGKASKRSTCTAKTAPPLEAGSC